MAGYGDDNGFAAWLAENGYELPDGAPAPAVLRQRGSAYVDATYGQRFTGAPTAGFMQPRFWPRTGARAGLEPIPDDLVPPQVIEASYHAALQEARQPGSLTVLSSAAQRAKREKIGPLETEYFEGSGDALADAVPMLSAVEGLLAPFLVQPVAVALGIRALG